MSRNQVKIMTCGNVDDGKSTLLGKIFLGTQNIYDDQLKDIETQSQKFRKNLRYIDYSLFLDGLLEEKTQGITIDLAFKYFKFQNKDYVIIDSPGHKEFTKNTANACTLANVALVLIDVSKPFSKQTKKHLSLVSQFPNIQNVIVCYNKMDKISYNLKKFEIYKEKAHKYSESMNLKINHDIPISALEGDNVLFKSDKIKYNGDDLLTVISNINIDFPNKINDSILAIQDIDIRDNDRLYFVKHYGIEATNKKKYFNLRTKEEVLLKQIYKEGKSSKKLKNENGAITLNKKISLAKHDVLSSNKSLGYSNSFKARIVWCSKQELFLSKRYLIKFRHGESNGFISKSNLKLTKEDSISEVTIELESPITIDSFNQNYDFSQFIIIDKQTNETSAFGYVLFNLDKGLNVHSQDIKTYKSEFNGKTIWLTGLPASGKTTIANGLGDYMLKNNIPFIILDGDNIRNTINKDLGFSNEDRIENNRRVAHLAKLISDSGVFAIVSTVSPTNEIRSFSRELHDNGKYIEVFINASIEECIKRDPKNLYGNTTKKNKNITGMHTKYDIPVNPELIINTEELNIINSKKMLIDFLGI